WSTLSRSCMEAATLNTTLSAKSTPKTWRRTPSAQGGLAETWSFHPSAGITASACLTSIHGLRSSALGRTSHRESRERADAHSATVWTNRSDGSESKEVGLAPELKGLMVPRSTL